MSKPPKIPDVLPTESVPAGPLTWIKNWMDMVRLWVQTRDPSTRVGDPLDKFISRRELVNVGVVSYTKSTGLGGITASGDPTPPPQPTGLVVSAGITYIFIQWSAPTYTQGGGNDKTLIYGAIWPDDASPEPTFSDIRTKLIDTADGAANIHAYSTNPNTRWCIWIKFKSRDGVLSTNPAGGTNGQQTRTGQDVSALLTVLANQITEAQLFSTLNARINLIDGSIALADSVNARVAAEALARVNADVAEALARANADTAETLDRIESVYRESRARLDAEQANAEALLRSILAQEADALSAASEVALARQDLQTSIVAGVSAEASARQILATRLDAADAITTALVSTESTARSTAIAAEATQRNLLATQFRGSYTGSDVNALTTGLLYQERIARATEDTALAQAITLLSAGAGEQFDWAIIWYFDAGIESWTGNGTPTQAAGFLRPANQASSAYVESPVISVDGAKYRQLRLRARKTGTVTWGGYLYWKGTGDTTWDNARRVALTEPTWDVSGIGLVTANPSLPATVIQIRVDLSSVQDASNYMELDWVAVGRPSPGASSAQLLTEQTARIDADSAITSSVTTLSSQVNNVTTGLPAAHSAITSEADTRASADTAIAGTVTALTARVDVTEDDIAAAQADIIANYDTLVDADTAEASARIALAAVVNHVDTGLPKTRADLLAFQTAQAAANTASAQDVRSLKVQSQEIDGDLLRAILAGENTRGLAETTLALARQELQTNITVGLEAEASARLDLLSVVNTNAAALTIEQTTRATNDAAITSSVTTLSAQVNNASTGLPQTRADLQSFQTAQAAANTASAQDVRSLKVQSQEIDGDLLRAIFAGEDTRGMATATLALARQELQTNITVGLEAEASARLALLSVVNANAAIVTSEQTTRATQDEAIAASVTALAATVAGNTAAITAEQTARADADTAIAGTVTTLSAQVNNVTTGLPATRATLLSDYYTAASTDSAIASSATLLRAYSDLGSKVFRQASEPTSRGLDPQTSAVLPLKGGDLWLDADDGFKPYQWSGSAWVDARDGAIAGVDARVTTVETTKIGYCVIGGVASDHTTKGTCEAAGGTWAVGLPIAQAVKQVSVSDGASTASLESRFTAQKTLNDGLKAQYTIKLDVNNHVSGYGVYADAAGNSEFIANVGKFAVTSPDSAVPLWAASETVALNVSRRISGTPSKVLVCKAAGVTGGSTPSIAGAVGVLVADGSVVWQIASRVPFSVLTVATTINGASVPAGTYMDGAFILNATINSAQVGSLTADKITTGTLNAALIFAGSLSAATGTFAGSLSAATGTFAGSLTAATGTFSGNLSAAGGTFTGALSGATGTFAGSLSAATGSFVGTVQVGSSPTRTGTTMTGAGTVLNPDGTVAFGNSTRSVVFDGTNLTLNSVALSAATGSFAGNVTGSIGGVAVATALTDIASRLSREADSILGAVISVAAVASPSGFKAGTLTWDAAGTRTGGSGVAMTPLGLVAYNGATPTFTLNASNGNATFAGELSAATGTFAGSLSAATGTFAGTVSVGTPAISGTTMTGAGALLNAAGSFAIGTAARNITYNGTDAPRMNGDWITTGNLAASAATEVVEFYAETGVNYSNMG